MGKLYLFQMILRPIPTSIPIYIQTHRWTLHLRVHRLGKILIIRLRAIERCTQRGLRVAPPSFVRRILPVRSIFAILDDATPLCRTGRMEIQVIRGCKPVPFKIARFACICTKYVIALFGFEVLKK